VFGVFYSSTITMMRGPINISFICGILWSVITNAVIYKIIFTSTLDGHVLSTLSVPFRWCDRS